MSHPSDHSSRAQWLRIAGVLGLAVLSACKADDHDSTPVLIDRDALKILGKDSLENVFVDATALGSSVAYLSAVEPFITIVDEKDHVTRQFGSPGEGPGEFRNPTSLDAQAETLYVWDVRQGAASLYDTLGRYLGRRRADATFGGVGPRTRTDYAGRPGLYRRMGSLAVTAAYPNAVMLPGEQRSYSLLALDDSGGVRDTVWASSLPASANEAAPQKPMDLVPIPLWARCSDTGLAVYDPESGVTYLRSPRGKVLRQFESRAGPVPISDEGLLNNFIFHFRRLYAAAHLPEPSTLAEEMGEWVREARINGTAPSTYPGFASILCDHRDGVWLNTFSLTDSPLGYSRTWTIFSEGVVRRSITLPEGFRLMLLTKTRGYGVVLDSTSAELPAWVELPK